MKNPFITSRFDNIYISVPELSLTVEVFPYLSLPSCLLPKKYEKGDGRGPEDSWRRGDAGETWLHLFSG